MLLRIPRHLQAVHLPACQGKELQLRCCASLGARVHEQREAWVVFASVNMGGGTDPGASYPR
jgi:hypothetical protein